MYTLLSVRFWDTIWGQKVVEWDERLGNAFELRIVFLLSPISRGLSLEL